MAEGRDFLARLAADHEGKRFVVPPADIGAMVIGIVYDAENPRGPFSAEIVEVVEDEEGNRFGRPERVVPYRIIDPTTGKPMLKFTAAMWREFIDAIKNGKFDPDTVETSSHNNIPPSS